MVRKSSQFCFTCALAISGTLMVSGCVPTSQNAGKLAAEPITVSNLDLRDRTDIATYEGEAIDLKEGTAKLNSVRTKRLLSKLVPDSRLMQAAQTHALHMARNGVFGHEFGPETKFQKRIFAQGFYDSAGENIGVGYQDIDAAIEGWMNSAGHRRNMLKRNYGLFGLAYARNVSGKNERLDHFWVLILGEKRDTKRMVVPFNPS